MPEGEARKFEHRDPHTLKVKQREPQLEYYPKSKFQLSRGFQTIGKSWVPRPLSPNSKSLLEGYLKRQMYTL